MVTTRMNILSLSLLFFTILRQNEVHSNENEDSSEYLVVNLPQGPVRGRKVIRENYPPFWNFLGIPFAKPPVGNLRFKAPVDAEPWNGTFDALKEGKICIQTDDSGEGLTGSEDCLFINVYTNAFPGRKQFRGLKPVMVYIYGGAFNSGAGDHAYQGPEYLVDEGVVYVSFNYRLGVLGFLSTEDDAIPGNAGLKDQVLALRWVQRNIAKFGGDPNAVTIFGESSGAAAVIYHLLSPMSKGLFQRAITQSGTASIPWALAVKPRETAFLISKSLGFNGKSSQELADFLRKIPAEKLVNTSLTTVPERDKYRFTRMIYVPTVEIGVKREEVFLADNPLHLLEKGLFQKVPLITGFNSAEGLISLESGGINRDWSRVEEINKNFSRYFKPELRFCKEEPCGDDMIARMKQFYFGNKPFTNDTMDNFIKMWSDLTFTEGIMHTVKNIASHSNEPLYLYHFSYDGSLGFLKQLIGAQDFPGVCHGDELGYLFNDTGVTAKTPKDSQTRDRMVSMWTNFAKTGNPTPPNQNTIPTWKPYTQSSRNYFDIGRELINKKNLLQKRVEFWEKLYSRRDNIKY